MSEYLAKKGIPFLSPLLSRTSVIICNKEEAHALTHEHYPYKMYEKLRKNFEGTFVITDGHSPIYAYQNRMQYVFNPPKVHVVDATGAGDAFAVGLVYSLIKHIPLTEALSNGCSVSKGVLSSIGATPGLPRKIKGSF
jgi:sugar/nucleoside kinase (ribokinase family)